MHFLFLSLQYIYIPMCILDITSAWCIRRGAITLWNIIELYRIQLTIMITIPPTVRIRNTCVPTGPMSQLPPQSTSVSSRSLPHPHNQCKPDIQFPMAQSSSNLQAFEPVHFSQPVSGSPPQSISVSPHSSHHLNMTYKCTG